MKSLTTLFQPSKAVRLLACFSTAILLSIDPSMQAQDRRGPFTREPRSLRTREVDQQHIRLDLSFDLDKQKFTGRATHRIAAFRPLTKLTLDAGEMRVTKVALLGADAASTPLELKYELAANSLKIELDREYPANAELRLAIDYEVEQPRKGAHFVVPDTEEPTQPRMVWTQSEPEYARFWFPCLDAPGDRITSETYVTAAANYFVLSNGKLQQKSENADGTVTWHWAQEQSHAPYLMSVVVGDFEAYEQQWDGIPITSYVPRGRLADAPRSFEKTPAMMRFFSEKIGFRYPWPKYAQICVDEYEWGGMEHTSATTLNLDTLHDERAHLDGDSDGLVAHELAHQWWGDLVTCKDWAELWLNESFATYFDSLWTEHDEGGDEATWQRRGEANAYLDEDRLVRRSIVNYRYSTPENMFDRHSYPKGSRVLHALRFELGDELFWRALHRYVTVNQHRAVETADLRTAIEEATGVGMTWFFDQWLYHGGHPEFHVTWDWDQATKVATVQVKQTQKVDELTPIFRSSIEIELAGPTFNLLRRVQVSKSEETFHFPLEARPDRVCFDPRDWVLKTLRFDKSKEECLNQLAHDAHLICRAQAVQGLSNWAQDDDVVAALIRAAKSDVFWGVRQEAVQLLGKKSSDVVRTALLEIAARDAKSHVRREAIAALGNFAHDEVRSFLRTAIKQDRSYQAVAEALRALRRVDGEKCEPDLLEALTVPSQRDVIAKAAVDGLVERRSTQGADRIAELLRQPQVPERRMTYIAALARLKPDDASYLDLLRGQLNNERRNVRRAAVDALVELGNPSALEWLQERRAKEITPAAIQAIDLSIDRLRAKQQDAASLRKELEDLRRQNKSLEERLRKLEQK
jgi:aminopeptidase N